MSPLLPVLPYHPPSLHLPPPYLLLLWFLLLFIFEIFLFRVLFFCVIISRFPVMVIVSSRFESAVSWHTFSLWCMRFIFVHIIFYTQSSTSIMLRVQSHFKVYVLKHLLKNFIYCLQFVLIFNHFIAVSASTFTSAGFLVGS